MKKFLGYTILSLVGIGMITLLAIAHGLIVIPVILGSIGIGYLIILGLKLIE